MRRQSAGWPRLRRRRRKPVERRNGPLRPRFAQADAAAVTGAADGPGVMAGKYRRPAGACGRDHRAWSSVNQQCRPDAPALPAGWCRRYNRYVANSIRTMIRRSTGSSRAAADLIDIYETTSPGGEVKAPGCPWFRRQSKEPPCGLLRRPRHERDLPWPLSGLWRAWLRPQRRRVLLQWKVGFEDRFQHQHRLTLLFNGAALASGMGWPRFLQ
jgi:hypothetical protein